MEKNYLLVSPDDDTSVRPNKVKYNCMHCTTRFLKAPVLIIYSRLLFTKENM